MIWNSSCTVASIASTLTTEGNVVHYGYIEKFIEKLNERFNIREIAYDRWGAVQMVQNLEGMGFTVVPFGQGFKDMNPPTKELMKLTLEKRIAHGGHPVLRWMMDNIFIKTDPAGNIKPDKEKSTEKIDGVVATIMALDRAIRCGLDNGESVYDERGILLLSWWHICKRNLIISTVLFIFWVWLKTNYGNSPLVRPIYPVHTHGTTGFVF